MRLYCHIEMIILIHPPKRSHIPAPQTVEGVSKCVRGAAKPSNVHNRRCSDHREQTVGGMSSHTNRPRERSNNSLSYNLFDLSRGRRVGRHATSAGSASPHTAVTHSWTALPPVPILIHPPPPTTSNHTDAIHRRCGIPAVLYHNIKDAAPHNKNKGCSETCVSLQPRFNLCYDFSLILCPTWLLLGELHLRHRHLCKPRTESTSRK